jgi:hypothetical protein
MTDTKANTYHDKTVAALEAFIHQRPNLEPGNYISSGWDEEGRKAYRLEARRITRDLNDARMLLSQVTGRTFTKAEWDIAFTAYSGRLSWDGTTLDYCIGQYWPTEYRASVCAVLAYLLWCDCRNRSINEPFAGHYWPNAARDWQKETDWSDMSSGEHHRRLSHFRRLFGRGLVHRWFN